MAEFGRFWGGESIVFAINISLATVDAFVIVSAFASVDAFATVSAFMIVIAFATVSAKALIKKFLHISIFFLNRARNQQIPAIIQE